MGYIYCITNKINNKKYIGQTNKTIEERLKEHIVKRNNSDYPLHTDMKIYGKDNFEICCLKEADNLDYWEKYYIEEYQSIYPAGYNITKGGAGISGYKHTGRTRELLRKSTKRYMNSLSQEELEVLGDKISKALSGVPKTMEHREKLSSSRKKLFSEGKLAAHNKGVPMGEEQKKKLSNAAKGKVSPRRIQISCSNGEIEKVFVSYMEASLWLIDNGYTKSKNRTSVTTTIKEGVTTGNKRYGFVWKAVV